MRSTHNYPYNNNCISLTDYLCQLNVQIMKINVLLLLSLIHSQLKFPAKTATYINYSKNYQLKNQSTYVYSLQQLMHQQDTKLITVVSTYFQLNQIQ